MTAVNAFLREETAYIFTDGQSYTRDGDLLGTVQKVEMFAHLPAVIAAHGQTLMRNAVCYRLGDACGSFDRLIGGVEQVMRETYQVFGVPDDVDGLLEFTIAGWSDERQRMELWSLADVDRPEVQAFTLHEVMAAIRPIDELLMAGLQTAGLDIETSDPVVLGLALTRLQRDREWGLLHNGRMIASVGSFVQMTTLTRDGIETRILERWEQAA